MLQMNFLRNLLNNHPGVFGIINSHLNADGAFRLLSAMYMEAGFSHESKCVSGHYSHCDECGTNKNLDYY